MANGGARPGAGRKKAAHTLDAEKAKAQLIADYLKHIKPINKALIDKALTGDIQAIKELHDRVYGKAMQPIEGNIKATLTITFDDSFTPRQTA